MTQCERVLRHIQDYGSITSAEAIQEYGIYRLASRISDLKKLGGANQQGNGQRQEPLRRADKLRAILD